MEIYMSTFDISESEQLERPQMALLKVSQLSGVSSSAQMTTLKNAMGKLIGEV